MDAPKRTRTRLTAVQRGAKARADAMDAVQAAIQRYGGVTEDQALKIALAIRGGLVPGVTMQIP